MKKAQSVKYVISSGLSWVVDNGLTYLLYMVMGVNSWAQIIARIVSSFFNFNMNRSFVFCKHGNYLGEMGKYYCLCIPQTAVSVILLHIVVEAFSVDAPLLAIVLKIFIELILFVISYFIQKKWVFM